MCDYCGCRNSPVIAELGADHQHLLAAADRVERLLAAGDREAARFELEHLLGHLREHTEVEEASLFAGLRASRELLDDVDALVADHHRVWDAVARFPSPDTPAWDRAVMELFSDLRAHIAREEYDLYPATVIAIGPREWDVVEATAARVRSRA